MMGTIYRFGDYRIDAAGREFIHCDQPRPLPPKALECLIYLVENRHRAIGRDELVSAVWGRANINGSALRQAILQIRRAIDSADDSARFIRTVPNFGYQWVADIRVEDPAELIPLPGNDRPSAGALPTAHVSGFDVPVTHIAPRSTRDHRSPLTQWRWALPVLLVLVLMLAGGWNRFDAGSTSIDASAQSPATRCLDGGSPVDVIAVLPVEVDAGDEQMGWVRLGLMESIAARLAKGGQRVVPSEDIVALSRNAAASELPDAIRSVICARYQVASRIQRSGSDWGVHMMLTSIDGTQREVEAFHTEAVAAARNASDHLLVMLGQPTRIDPESVESLADDELLARIQIALFTNELDVATDLIGSASPRLRESKQFRWNELDLAFRRGEFDAILQRLQAMEEEPTIQADPVERAKVWTALALVEVQRSQPDRALVLLDRAMPSLDAPEQIGRLGNAYNVRGLAHTMLGNYDQASSDFAVARHAFTAAGRVLGLMMVDSNDGMLLLSRNRPAEALPLLTRSAERAERLGRQESLAFAAGFIGWAYLSLLQTDSALAAFERFEPHVEQANESYAWCQYRYYKARVSTAAGQFSKSARLIDEVLRSATDTCRSDDGLIQVAAAELYFLRGESEAALTQAQRAVDALTQPDMARERAEAWLIAVRSLLAIPSTQSQVLERELQRFSDWAQERGDPAAKLRALMARAERNWHEQRYDQAEAGYDEALRLARSEGVPADVASVTISYGHNLLAAGELSRADQLAAQVSRWAEQDFGSAVLLAAVYQAQGNREQWRVYVAYARALAGERELPAHLVDAASLRLAASSVQP